MELSTVGRARMETNVQGVMVERATRSFLATDNIRSLVIDGRRIVDKEGIREAVRHHFTTIFHPQPEQPPSSPLPSAPPLASRQLTLDKGTLSPLSPSLYFDLLFPRPCGPFSSPVIQVSGDVGSELSFLVGFAGASHHTRQSPPFVEGTSSGPSGLCRLPLCY